jgi:hypothetical protein
MAILLNQSTLNAYLRHTFASAPGYPITIALKVLNQGTGSTGDYLNLSAPGGSETASLIRSYFGSNGTTFGWGSRTSWGSTIEEISGGASQYGVSNLVTDTSATFKNVFIVAPSNTSAWTLYSEDYPTGRSTLTPNNATSGEFATCTDLLIGAFLNLGAISNHARIAVAEIAVWTDARTNANYTSYAANTPAETINPASLYEVWSLDVSGSAGSSVTGTLTGLVNGRSLSVNGTVVKAYQAHPVSRGSTLVLDAGSYSISGQAVTTKATRQTTLDSSSYSWSGQNVNLLYTQPGVYTLPLDPGSYLFTGSDALVDLAMVLSNGTYSITGQSLDFSLGVPAAYSISLENSSYNWNGRPVRLAWSEEPVGNTKQTNLSISLRMGL